MNLREYLATEGALSVAELRERIGAKSDAQIRQWQHGYAERRPNEEYATAIERATRGVVDVESLRPDLRWVRVTDESWPHPEGRPLVDATRAANEEESKARA